MDIQRKIQSNNQLPRYLTVLIYAEFWDRFSFCGTLTILILYLTKNFSYTDVKAYSAWGVYLALGYVTPVVGGVIADKFWGFKKAIITGSIMMVIGNLLIGFQSTSSLYIGLSIALCGIGLFKGNISSLVGTLFAPDDDRRHNAYSKFYMGIMLGAILGTLVFGLLAERMSWQICFWLSGAGNLSALVLLYHYRKQIFAENPVQWPKNGVLFFSHHNFIIYAFLIVITAMFSGLFIFPAIGNSFLGLISAISVILCLIYCMRDAKEDGKKILGLTMLSVVLIFYYAASFQVNGPLVVAIARNYDFTLLGRPLPATFFASLEAFFAVIFIPVFSKLYLYLAKHFFVPSNLFKIIMGLIFAGFSFIVFAMVFSSLIASFFGLILANLLLGVSVACIFPTHMAVISEYAPISAKGTLMGMSFLSDALSGYLGSEMVNLHLLFVLFSMSSNIYTDIYTSISFILFASALALIMLVPYFNSLFLTKNKSITLYETE